MFEAMRFGEQIDVSSWDGGEVDVEVDGQVDAGYAGDVEGWQLSAYTNSSCTENKQLESKSYD